MSEAPERIWAWSMTPEWKTAWDVDDAEAPPHAAPYIRADLVEAAVKRTIEACAQEVKARAKPHVRDRLKMLLAKQGYRMRDPVLARAYIRTAKTIRAIAQDPEAIAKIVSGK